MAYIGNTLRTAQPNYQIIDDISASFDGSTTSFALQVGGATPAPFPVSAQHCLISVGGVVQQPDPSGTDGFLLSGSNIVFSAAPSAGENFFGVVLAGADYINVGAEFPDGSVANPSITFDQDLDTGVYRVGANSLGISTGGTEAARFTSDQRLVVNDTADTSDARVMVRGNTGVSGFSGVIGLKRTDNTPGVTDNIGLIQGYTSDSEVVSRIETRRDNGTWTAATSYPTAIDFYTVADGTAALRDQSTLSLSSRGGVTFDGDVGFDFINRSSANTLNHILARCQTQCQRISTISSSTPGVFDIGPVNGSDYRYEIVMIGAHNSSSVNATGYYLATTRSNSNTIVVRTIHETMSGSGTVAFTSTGSALRMTINNNGGTAYRNLTVTVRSSGPNSNTQYIAMDSSLDNASPS